MEMETIYEVSGLYVEPWSHECNDSGCDRDYLEKSYYSGSKGVKKTIGFYKTMKQAREAKERSKNQVTKSKSDSFPLYKDVKIIERNAIALNKAEYAIVEKKISILHE